MMIFRMVLALTRHIKTGTWRALVCGAAAGAVAGGVVAGCFLFDTLIAPVALVGAILGAAVGACFEKVVVPETEYLARPEGWMGGLRHWSGSATSEVGRLALLFDHALVQVDTEGGDAFGAVVEGLGCGVIPKLTRPIIIPIETIESIEMRPDEFGVRIVTMESPPRHVFIEAGDHAADRDVLVARLETRHGSPFGREEREMGWVQNLFGPAFCVVFALVCVAGAGWLSAHWRANPPPFPVGESEPDPLVAFLMWAGPLRTLAGGSLLVFVPVGWFVWRVFSPVRTQFLLAATRTAPWNGVLAASGAE
jgi:hypothetical protein